MVTWKGIFRNRLGVHTLMPRMGQWGAGHWCTLRMAKAWLQGSLIASNVIVIFLIDKRRRCDVHKGNPPNTAI
jgi:hypothetical protein